MWLRTNQAKIAFVILTLAVAASDAGYVHLEDQRRHDSCGNRQQLYDGEVETVRFLAREVHATKAQTAQALLDLHSEIGARPVC